MASTQPAYCLICGSPLTTAVVAGRERLVCTECGYVHYLNPVPAVGLIVEMDDGVVFIRRGHPPHEGEWALPSGFIEADEGVQEAARRECEEETGLKVELVELFGVYSFPEGPPTSGIIVFYRAKPIGGRLRAGDDASEVRIFPPDQMPPVPFRTHRQVLERWRRQMAGQKCPEESHPEFTIRPARPEDEPRVLELLRLIPPNAEMDDEALRAAAQRFRECREILVFVAERPVGAPRVIGFAALSIVRTLTGQRAWIDDMAVDPLYQRRGVGAALLEAVMRQANRMGMTHLFLNPRRGNEPARAFYRAAGFRDEHVGCIHLG